MTWSCLEIGWLLMFKVENVQTRDLSNEWKLQTANSAKELRKTQAPDTFFTTFFRGLSQVFLDLITQLLNQVENRKSN